MKRRLALLLAAFLFVTPAFAATTRYVTKSGTDSGACTALPGCLTIAYGLSQMSGGDSLNVGDGTYAEGIEPGAIPDGIDDAHRTLVRAINRKAVTLTALNSTLSIISLKAQHYITVDGINTDATSTATATAGVVVLGGDDALPSTGGSYLTYQYGEITGNIGSGCLGSHGYPAGRSTHITVSHVTIHECGYGSGNTTIHALYVNWADSLIEYSTLYNTDGSCLLIFSSDGSYGASNNVVNGNVVHDCGNAGLRAGSGTGQRWSNNISYSNGAVIGGSAGVWIGFDVLSGTIDVYNNTLYGNTGKCIHNDGGGGTSIATNNICYANSNNIIDGSITSTDNLTTNPSFVNAATGNFHLAVGSPAIGVGANLYSTFTNDLSGAARPSMGPWDLGPYVFPITINFRKTLSPIGGKVGQRQPERD